MASNGAAQILSLVATIVRVVCAVIAAVILIHAVFVFFEANPANGLVSSTASWRDTFGWFTKDLFTPTDPKIAETINDVLAAIVWVVVGTVLSKSIVRMAPARTARAK